MMSSKSSNSLNCEIERITRKSQPITHNLVLANYALGVSLKPLKRFNYLLKYLSALIIGMMLLVLWGEYKEIAMHLHQTFPFYAETIVLVLQLKIGLVKNIYFHFKRQSFYKLLNTAGRNELLRDLEIFDLELTDKMLLSHEIGEMLRHSWRNINTQLTYFAMTFFGAIFYYLIKPFGQYFYQCYILGNRDFELPLAFEVRLPTWQVAGGYEFPTFPLRFIIILFQPYCCGLSTISFDGAFIISTMHVVALLRTLRHLLNCSTDESRVPAHLRVPYLCICVRFYARITEYHASVDRFFKYVILAQYASSSLIICIVLYNVSIGLESDSFLLVRMFVYLMAIVLEISIFNVDAQQVTNQSEKVRQAWYDCVWYNESAQFKYIIHMMLLFTAKAYSLSVGGFAQMSHNLLLSTMRLSGNFFLLLRNVNEKS